MMTHPSGRADDGSVLRTAMAALLLIVVGLGLMAWDDPKGLRATPPLSLLQHP